MGWDLVWRPDGKPNYSSTDCDDQDIANWGVFIGIAGPIVAIILLMVYTDISFGMAALAGFVLLIIGIIFKCILGMIALGIMGTALFIFILMLFWELLKWIF